MNSKTGAFSHLAAHLDVPAVVFRLRVGDAQPQVGIRWVESAAGSFMDENHWWPCLEPSIGELLSTAHLLEAGHGE